MINKFRTCQWLVAAMLAVGPLSTLSAQSAAAPAVAELRKAARAADSRSPAAAAAAWRALLEAAPEDGEGWYRLGYSLHLKGDLEAALVAHRRAAALDYSPNAAFNIACALARLGHKDAALDALEAAIEAGFVNAAHAAGDSDLATLRAHPRFSATLDRMRAAAKALQERRIKVAVLIYPGVELLDFAGPLEAFGAASGRAGRAFAAFTVARSKEPLSAGGVHLVADYDFEDCPQPQVVVIPGGSVRNVTADGATMAWLTKVRADAEISMSVCNGAFALARQGALGGRRVTTHWSAIERLAAECPEATVVSDARFVDTGDVVTAAGVSAGIDGALHVIERYCGREVAWETAHYMEYEWRPDRIGSYGLYDKGKESDRQAIAGAVQGYLDCLLGKGGAECAEAALHPDLDKLGIAPGRGENGKDGIYPRTFADMRQVAEKVAARGGGSGQPASYELLDLHDAIAVVKLKAPWGQDYLTLGRFDGRWLVRHILWQYRPSDDKK